MVDLWCELIIEKSSTFTFNDVKDRFKESVRKTLLERGYDTNGDLINPKEV